ncbi:uncharacterized protein [Nicotiana sylvestris]|uniref:uncharacterized protein n=1 Tax=Nicotiana sylvestris TaxID=4096 RepID=UPI00388C409B
MEDVVEEFNRLQQKSNVEDYLVKFDDLKAQMIVRNPALNDAHFLSSFVGGLKDEIKYSVKLFKPKTLSCAIEQARMQERAIEAALKKNQPVAKVTTAAKASVPIVVQRPTAAAPSKPSPLRLTPEVYEYRKANQLCFRCGEKFGPGHMCQFKQLQCLTGEVEEVATIQEEPPPEIKIELDLGPEIQETVCFNALSGTNMGVNTILVRGVFRRKELTILVDLGSTHNFINEITVKETGYAPVFSNTLRVTVADGIYMYTNSVCPKFSWKMNGKLFEENLRILQLGGYDIVLGNDWMKKFNPTKFDHEKNCVTIRKKGNKVVLQGINQQRQLGWTSGSTMGKLIKKG